MLNKIALIAGLLVMGFASQAHAALVHLGPGGCRTTSGGQGTSTLHSNVAWGTCRNLCLNNPNCKAVEYTIRANGTTGCEIHTTPINRTAESDLRFDRSATCWLNSP